MVRLPFDPYGNTIAILCLIRWVADTNPTKMPAILHCNATGSGITVALQWHSSGIITGEVIYVEYVCDKFDLGKNKS